MNFCVIEFQVIFEKFGLFYCNISGYQKVILQNLKKTAKNLHISITDEGSGIKENEIKNIFKKYYSSAKKYSNVGVGLGLYIANKIILAHGGKIQAKNTKDKGACFDISLPLK